MAQQDHDHLFHKARSHHTVIFAVLLGLVDFLLMKLIYLIF